ncbi:MAG: YdjY domain-containing protein [Planctomycetota bacterium]|nr:YdjY domain-containing protein [Planctomycetota bacterium]
MKPLPIHIIRRHGIALVAVFLMVSCDRARVVQTNPVAKSVRIGEHITVLRDDRSVEIDAIVVLDDGFLEQLVCGRGTREHESLLVSMAPASQIHAALLLLGIESGKPGLWSMHQAPSGEWKTVKSPPEGPSVAVDVRWKDEEGCAHEAPLSSWVVHAQSGAALPNGRFVFAGSILLSEEGTEPTPPTVYAGDLSGSIVGLVTFGDEVIAMNEVISDQADVEASVWLANPEAMPPLGTRVTLILRAAQNAPTRR